MNSPKLESKFAVLIPYLKYVAFLFLVMVTIRSLRGEVVVVPKALEISETGILTLDYARMGGCGDAQIQLELQILTDLSVLVGLTDEQRALVTSPEPKVLMNFVLDSDDPCKRAAISDRVGLEVVSQIRKILPSARSVILITPLREGSFWVKLLKI